MGGPKRWHGVLRTVEHACHGRRALWFLCFSCGHARRVDPRKLIARYGETLISDLSKKQRCRRYGEKWNAVVSVTGRPIPTIGQLPERQAWPVGWRGVGTRYSDRRYQFVHKVSADLGMKIGRAA
jgi:hypothetical protein